MILITFLVTAVSLTTAFIKYPSYLQPADYMGDIYEETMKMNMKEESGNLHCNSL